MCPCVSFVYTSARLHDGEFALCAHKDKFIIMHDFLYGSVDMYASVYVPAKKPYCTRARMTPRLCSALVQCCPTFVAAISFTCAAAGTQQNAARSSSSSAGIGCRCVPGMTLRSFH